MRYLDSIALLDRRNRFAIGAQYFGTRQADLNFPNVQGDRGAKTKDQLNEVANAGIYTEEQFEATDTFTVVVGGHGQYAHRRVCDRFQTENDPKVDDSGIADYRSFTPKVGFIWQALPTMQVYGNASRGVCGRLARGAGATDQDGGAAPATRQRQVGGLRHISS
jgi:iron complex outermembrane receptor protein